MHKELHTLPYLDKIIEASLRRSTGYGIDPHQDGAPESTRLSAEELQERIAEQMEFYTLAREQLECLYRLLKGTGFCMALADRDGYILYIIGDDDLTEHFHRRRCIPGYRWTERDIGTCAIGLVLEEHVPVFLPGDRMYATQAKTITNAGAPVFAPNGKDLLGVVSLSGYTKKMHVHTLGLVRQSAETITAQLRASERNQEIAIKNQYMIALLESDSRGIVTVSPDGHIFQTNQKARTLLNIVNDSETELITDCIGPDADISTYLKNGRAFRAREIQARHNGNTYYMSLDPIRMNNGEFIGGLLTLQEKKAVLRMAVQMTGPHAHFTFDSILGKSKQLKAAIHLANISAGTAAPVLLYGETGTGKELFAQAIHNHSSRRNGPFIAINCAAIPKELLESELFGYEGGAFTGAQQGGKPGKVELADTGTLFLDEIGDMPFEMQVKLLRVLQFGDIQRVGGLRTIPVDFRIISATNKDLQEAITNKEFREDLYYRISTLKITIPPLRERPGDIMQLVDHFIKRHAAFTKSTVEDLPQETTDTILNYSWPGNIRQLESAIERAVHLAENGIIEPHHLGLNENATAEKYAATFSAGMQSLETIEAQAVSTTLTQMEGNLSKTAAILGISRPTLYRKLEKIKALGLHYPA